MRRRPAPRCSRRPRPAAASAWPTRSAPSSSARALITLCGVTGWFERVMDSIPLPIANGAAGRRAGALRRWTRSWRCRRRFALVLAMLAAYLVARRWWPRYAVVTVLAVGTAFAAASGRLQLGAVDWRLTRAGLRRAGVLVAAPRSASRCRSSSSRWRRRTCPASR